MDQDLATCDCFGGRSRLLLQKLRGMGRKNRERAWSKDKVKVENRIPPSNYRITGGMLQRSHKIPGYEVLGSGHWIDS